MAMTNELLEMVKCILIQKWTTAIPPIYYLYIKQRFYQHLLTWRLSETLKLIKIING
jgi:hypothetical protein